MTSCTLCSAAKPGYTIEFADTEARAYIETLLRSWQPGTWQITPSGKLWVDAQVVVKYVDYWSQCLNPGEWLFRRAVKDISGKFSVGEPVSWDEVCTQVPAFWIDQVIASDSIRMMYQPIVDVSSGRATLLAYETLARGFNEDGSIIPPTELFKQAKEQERLFALDRHCRVKAVHAGAQTPGDTLVFINFVPTSIYKPEHCLRTTMAAAQQVGIDFSRLVFEVVETEYVDDVDHLKSIFDYYRSHGVQCALDDVGAGFNDIAMLKALAPNVIKLDREIASGIAWSADKRLIAETILVAACQVGARALAEGIETVEDAAVLADMGYHWQQGFLYGQPSFEPGLPNPLNLALPLAA